MKITRRELLKTGAIISASSALSSPISAFAASNKSVNSALNLSVFSKHLQFLNYNDMADAAAEIGFNGLDLTVRPGGHVLPERVTTDLTTAVNAMQKVGLAPNLMTTSITEANQPHTQAILKTAGELGFQYYRMGYYRFPQNKEVPEALKHFNTQLKALAALNKQTNIKGAYQNHAGESFVGAQLWDIWHMLEGVDGEYMGCQYDIRHASIEGAESWPVPLNMLRKRINTIVLKDYKWQKNAGKWSLQNVPIGEGMVDFNRYFALLKKLNINVPVSMHFEYDLGGAEHGKSKISVRQKDVFKAMKRDLDKAQRLWAEA